MLDIGFLISFAGNVTFKKAENLRESARVVPLDKMLVETDCPFLTPVPFRGKRNEPAFVAHTAAFLAELHGVEPETIAEHTTRNFLRFFDSDRCLANYGCGTIANYGKREFIRHCFKDRLRRGHERDTTRPQKRSRSGSISKAATRRSSCRTRT